MAKNKLSVVLATRNEEDNIGLCLNSVEDIADEIVVVDEESSDNTVNIVKKRGAKVFSQKHEPIFHKTKQKAIDIATGDWILQLDADERVTTELGKEILSVLDLSYENIKVRRPKDKKKWTLYTRHQKLIEERDGKIGKESKDVVAFFLPRLNYFLGKPIIHAGVYPDANIRLIKKGKARFPAKSVHEQMIVDGEVGWLFNDLEHHDSPTLKRYLERMNRYTDLHAKELSEKKVPGNVFQLLKYSTIKPIVVFIKLFFRHLGFLDGIRGFLWSFFSAMHFPLAYYKYWQEVKK